jgi:2-polyprenyl-3-methyl-5-hydroxy-6-metoxy-1,4-benzoquinol methylase
MTEQNKKQFVDKWGFSIDYSNIARTALIDMIKEDKNKPIEVLELGCAMGSTLNRIKRFWPNARIHGVEYDPGVAEVAAHITDIIQGDVENMVIPYEQKQFDYIICADVLEHLRDPEATVRRFMPYLKDDGHFLISLPNIRHHAVLSMIALQGRFDYGDSGILDRTHVKFFTRDTAIEMLESAGLKVLKVDRNYNGQVGENEFVTRLVQTFDVSDPEELNVFQYYFLAKKR